MKKANNNIARNLLLLCFLATVVTFAVQYLFEGKVNADVLSFIIPACVTSYLFGRQDGQKEHTEKEVEKNQLRES